MGLGKFIKRTVRKAENFGRRVVGKGNIGERGEAADQMLQKYDVPVQRQAGQGQIKYTGEVWK